MDDKQQKGIYFDLDSKLLERYYPKKDWHNAYKDVRLFLEKEGFEHIQGSGYHSKDPLSEVKVMAIIHRMIKAMPWLEQCVNVCTISDVPITTDITHVFRRTKDIERTKNDRDQGITWADWKSQIMKEREYNKTGIVEKKTIKQNLQNKNNR